MLGKKLEKLVQESEFTNAHIVDYLGISVNTLYNLYKKESFDTAIVTKSCELFNVPLSYFLGEDAKNIDIVKTPSNKEEELLRENYSLSKELVEVYRELSEFKNKFIAFQEKAFDRMSNNTTNLGKHKASSNQQATLSTEKYKYKYID